MANQKQMKTQMLNVSLRVRALATLLLFLALTVGSQSEETKATNSTAVVSAFQTYKSEKFNFQISYPKDWLTSPFVKDTLWQIASADINEMGSISISTTKVGFDSPDENASFLEKALNQDDSVLKEEIRHRFSDGKFLGKGKSQLGSHPAIYFKSSYTLKKLNANIPVIVNQIMCPQSGLRYLVTFETPENLYQKTYSQFQTIISTFVFTNSESSPSHTGVKAFDDLFFGEEKSAVERKRKNFVKVGERLFEFSCGYEKIDGKERLSKVNLFATWTDTAKSAIDQNLDEIKEVLSAKFGKPNWERGYYEGRLKLVEAMESRSVAAMTSVDPEANDDRFLNQYQWKMGEEKTVTVFMREQTIVKERKETVEVQSANFFRAAKTEEVSRFDKHRENKIWIEIESPAVKKMKAKESAIPF